MAVFYNQATLSYNNGVTSSNVVAGELLEVLSATKTAVSSGYRAGDSITYIISIINSGTLAYTDLTVSDNLGAYGPTDTPIYPLTYVADSVRYFVNGVLQTTPTVQAGPPLSIGGISVPAGGNAIIVYETDVNQFAPLGVDSTIVNEATISGGGITTPITVTETVGTDDVAILSISKAISPVSVVENGTLNYTFIIENVGNTEAIATDDVIVTDTFNPILSGITVTFNNETWTEGVNYTYNEATGEFATIAGQITIPAATYAQDPVTGAWAVNPGVGILRITGTI